MNLGKRRKGRPPPIDTDLYSPARSTGSEDLRFVSGSLERLLDENADIRCRVHDMIDAFEDAFVCCERRALMTRQRTTSRGKKSIQHTRNTKQGSRRRSKNEPGPRGNRVNIVIDKRREAAALREELRALELQAARQRRALAEIGVTQRQKARMNDQLKQYIRKQRTEYRHAQAALTVNINRMRALREGIMELDYQYRALLSGRGDSRAKRLNREVEELEAYRSDLAAKRQAVESRDRSDMKTRVEILDDLQCRISELSSSVKHAERAARVANSRLREIKRLHRSAEKEGNIEPLRGLALAG
ncbi:hypothetical protein FOZ61_006480 [Perkinsus olseni]|uniref:Uncharacterized protein n=1 Tax=Perkinsus olseni TaxID=32597 RepID=A0A7J6MR84_PEROL|nr:hypothetical protein FOZ61_006480 [Perkinsus olseni]KAF4673847.1 hypothetical protein FOL46_006400 [Perkinsus olseni]